MKRTILLGLALVVLPLSAGIQLQTSINDIYYRGTNVQLGQIILKVDSNDFPAASAAEPNFIQLSLADGLPLCETLVDMNAPGVEANPIYLAMELRTDTSAVMAAAIETVSVVRWVSGESSIWVRIQSASDTWLSDGGLMVAPSVDRTVSWCLGISARSSDTSNTVPTVSNLPFNTRNPVGFPTSTVHAFSTLLCLNASESELVVSGFARFSARAFGPSADLGNGFYSAQDETGPGFSNNFRIGRAKERSCTSMLTHVSAVDNGASWTAVAELDLSCLTGGALINTDLYYGAYLTFSTENRGRYGFVPGSVRFLGSSAGAEELSDGFQIDGVWYYRTARLIWTGDNRPLGHFNREVEVVVATPDDEAEIRLDVAWSLIDHGGPEDDVPFIGSWQNRRCQAGFLELTAEPWALAGSTDAIFVTGQPSPFTLAAPGDEVVLSVGANGPNLAYQWRKNGEDIVGATGASLVLQAVAVGDVGNYDCQVSNGWGSVLTRRARLAVSGADSSLLVE